MFGMWRADLRQHVMFPVIPVRIYLTGRGRLDYPNTQSYGLCAAF
jgi:hypothetical protein